MSLEITKGTSTSVNNFLLKRGQLIKQLVLNNTIIDPDTAENLAGKLPNLQTLTIRTDGNEIDQYQNLKDEDLCAIEKMCDAVSLSSVSLFGLNSASQSGIYNFVSHFETLTILSLNNCAHLADEGILRVATACRSLRQLSMRNTNIGDQGLQTFSEHCNSLIKADFGECPRIGDVGVEFVASTNSNLLELSIDHCPEITEKSLISLAKSCGRLQALNLEATGIRKLPSAVICLHNLRQLKLRGCKRLEYPFKGDSELVNESYSPNGFKQIMSYFNDLQLTHRIKVFVIGEPNVGKSALIKCLSFDNPLMMPQNESFSGVSIWDPSSLLGNISPGKFIFEIWELPDDICGLGEIFYITNAIFLVVFDLKNSDNFESVIKSVVSIWSRVPSASIIVVGTKKDRLFDEEAVNFTIIDTENKLRKLLDLRSSVARSFANEILRHEDEFHSSTSFPNIFKQLLDQLTELETNGHVQSKNLIHAVSCRNRDGIVQLRQELIERCKMVDSFSVSLPLTPDLLQFYENLQQLRSRNILLLPWIEFSYYAKQADIPIYNIEQYTKFLHDTGIIVDFRYLSRMTQSESFVCIDPPRLLVLFNKIHSWPEALPSTDRDEGSLIEIFDRGMILGRLLPGIWQISDSDQLEFMEQLSCTLGIMCPVTSAVPPIMWDKILPFEKAKPLTAHRCSFGRRLYLLPHLSAKLPKLARPIHWLPELAEDDCQLKMVVKLPPDVLQALEPSYQRLIASLPSLFVADSASKVGVYMENFDMSQRLLLMQFGVCENDSPRVQIHVRVGLSETEGVNVTTRVNREDLTANKYKSVIWFYTVYVLRTIYYQLTQQFSGVPVSIFFESLIGGELAPVMMSFPEMYLEWQQHYEEKHQKDSCSFLFPPIALPSDAVSSLELFDNILAELRHTLMNQSIRVDPKSLTTRCPVSSDITVVGDVVVVNEGCLRRGINEKMHVSFMDDILNRERISLSGASASLRQTLLNSTLMKDLGRRNFHRLPSLQSGLIHNDSSDMDSSENEAIQMNVAHSEVNSLLDSLSVISGSLPSLNSPTSKRKTIRVVAQKRKRYHSPPPANRIPTSPDPSSDQECSVPEVAISQEKCIQETHCETHKDVLRSDEIPFVPVSSSSSEQELCVTTVTTYQDHSVQETDGEAHKDVLRSEEIPFVHVLPSSSDQELNARVVAISQEHSVQETDGEVYKDVLRSEEIPFVHVLPSSSDQDLNARVVAISQEHSVQETDGEAHKDVLRSEEMPFVHVLPSSSDQDLNARVVAISQEHSVQETDGEAHKDVLRSEEIPVVHVLPSCSDRELNVPVVAKSQEQSIKENHDEAHKDILRSEEKLVVLAPPSASNEVFNVPAVDISQEQSVQVTEDETHKNVPSSEEIPFFPVSSSESLTFIDSGILGEAHLEQPVIPLSIKNNLLTVDSYSKSPRCSSRSETSNNSYSLNSTPNETASDQDSGLVYYDYVGDATKTILEENIVPVHNNRKLFESAVEFQEPQIVTKSVTSTPEVGRASQSPGSFSYQQRKVFNFLKRQKQVSQSTPEIQERTGEGARLISDKKLPLMKRSMKQSKKEKSKCFCS